MSRRRPRKPFRPTRRTLIGGLAAAGIGGKALAAARRDSGKLDAALRENIQTVVVIFAENRSFNNLFHNFPGLKQPLSAVSADRLVQRDRNGQPLAGLPPIWGGLVPTEQ